MGSNPQEWASSGRAARQVLPDYLPARMVNEFVYCPRLFFYEWVEGLFAPSADTEEGKAQHRRVDKEGQGLPAAGEEPEEKIHARSITLSSEELRLIAKMDLLEVSGGKVTPVDYKHGAPREVNGALELWPPDRVQLGVQALILWEHGYECEEGVVYYWKTRQRVRVRIDQKLEQETRAAVAEAWATALRGKIPPPLEDSPKCGGCSLAGICLPDETNRLRGAAEEETGQLLLFGEEEGVRPAARGRGEIRRLVTPRMEQKPLYVDTQGMRIGRSGGVLQVKEKERLAQEVRINELCQVNLMGNIQITTQAVQSLCEAGVPIAYFSQGGWFYGITMGLGTKNVFLRRTQFRLAESEWMRQKLARRLVEGKIRNQRVMLLRNHEEPDRNVLAQMKELAERAARAESLEALLGIEGNAAKLYFHSFSGMLKSEEEGGAGNGFRFDFERRNRRPPRDPVNALLSLGYAMLARDLTIACYAVGFDPMMGFYHQPRFGRPALALDLMEPFRPLIADSATLSAINTKMITLRDFYQMGDAVALTSEGRKAYYRAYELRMDSLVTHPQFDYRVSYRRLLEIQVRLLARFLEGEISEYPVFVTR